jgi:hypothetical protein
MRVNYKISEVLRAEFSQKNSLFSGKSLTGSSSQESSGTATSQYGLTPRSETGSESYRSLSTAKLAWLPLARLKLSVDLTSDYYKEKGVDPDLILTFGNSIDYTISNYSIKANTRYSKRNTGIYNQEEMTEDFTASYAPNRSLQSSINGEYSRLDDNGKITTYIQATQRIAYTINRSSINKAKLLDIIEETTVSRSGNRESTGSYPDRKSMSLRANYYPTKNLFLGASSRYSLLDPGNVTEWFASSNVGFNYNKLQTTVEYAYGKRNGGTDNRIEKKISANLKKQF